MALSGFRSIIEKYHTLIAAVLTITAAILAIALVFINAGRTEAVDDVRSLTDQVKALEQQAEVRQDTIETLQSTTQEQAEQLAAQDAEIAERDARIEELERSDSEPPTPSGNATIRNQGEVRLVSGGDSIDINSRDDQLWGSAPGQEYSTDRVSYYSPILYMRDMDLLRLTGGQVASYETCTTNTGYAPALQIEVSSLEGTNICLRSAAGNYGTVQVINATPDEVILNLTTWTAPS